MPVSLAELRSRVDALPLRDRRSLHRRLAGIARVSADESKSAATQAALADVERAEAALARRAASVPAVRYPAGLPIVDRKDEIAAAIRDHQVVVVAGETGSGKTTQLPKICLELGRGVRGAIGHTQPRRIAARAVAERIASELDTPLGAAVGYKVRFTDRAHADTLVKVMTDGILLAELQQDRLLSGYDTIIVDEAHERSLNIDFILGYLKQLLPRRPDLKVIVTSATIDPQRFAEHFGGAPIVEVSGRMYPVEVRYRPLVDDTTDDDTTDDESDDESVEPRDQVTAICDAVNELCREGPGDILVFLSGEREIRDTAEALRKRDLRDVDVLPLYARLSSSEQHRVFEPHAGRRIVLATNVAETSLTVPGIRYVVDPGTARISRYSYRTKVQRLPIEPISQASAKQRAGRCGRVEAGVCIRLYSEDDFAGRPEFTDPEILRTNLAAVILQMAALGLGDVAAFPFVEPPDRRNIKDGLALLEELGAVEQAGGAPKLTAVGRKLAALPVDPRIARMIVHADSLGCVRETIVIAAALSIVDPRERPLDAQQAADEQHARFADAESDFLGYLTLWEYLREKQAELSSSKFRRMCRKEFLNYLRVREWQDLVAQLRQVARSIGIRVNEAPAPPPLVHQALLSGLLSHIGLRDVEKRDYLGARGGHFAIFPGSTLFKKQPRWVMAAELVETTRLWGRVCARIEPEWVEPLAAHLVKRSYSEPHWEARRGAAMAVEKVMLYGIPIVAARRVGYARVDPVLSRELFIRHALVEGDWQARHGFLAANQATVEEIAGLEERVRRRDLVVDDEATFELYDNRIPRDVVSARHFDSWWKKARRRDPELLTFRRDELLTPAGRDVDLRGFPGVWRQGDFGFALSYAFEPGAEVDGVTVHIPVAVLNQLVDADFSWHIQGWREELVVALIRSLPKALRRHFVPAPDVARQLDLRETTDGSLEAALARALWRRAGVEVNPGDFDVERLPPHLRIRFAIESDDGKLLAAARDLNALRERLTGSMRQAISAASSDIEKNGLRAWEFGALPERVEHVRAGLRVRGYPALVDQGNAVGVRVFETSAEAEHAMRQGLRRLLSLNVASPAKALQRQLPNQTKLALSRNAPGGVSELLDDCLACAIDTIAAAFGEWPRDEATFSRLLERVRAELPDTLTNVVTTVVDVLTAAHEVEVALKAATKTSLDPQLLPALVDMRGQLAGLVHRGFATQTGAARLPDLPRYLTAISRRLERLPGDVNRDRARMWEVEQAQELLEAARGRGDVEAATLADARWLIEELRVSLFAQALGTAQPVSLQRIARLLAP
ncbi:MAG TPA: ATP-dependent RNA helicase HrpA [Acidothermaceae bacterium]|nr:ATP-dependent RNA helicase HrpA [Acidothermaceae bacterium]